PNRDFRGAKSAVSTTRTSKAAALTWSTQPAQQPQFGSLLTTIAAGAARTPKGAVVAATPIRSALLVIGMLFTPLPTPHSSVRAAYDRHQLFDLTPLVGLVARSNRMLDAMAHVIAEDFLFQPAQRALLRS